MWFTSSASSEMEKPSKTNGKLMGFVLLEPTVFNSFSFNAFASSSVIHNNLPLATFFLFTIVNWMLYRKHLSLLGFTNATNTHKKTVAKIRGRSHVCNKKNVLPLLNECQRIFLPLLCSAHSSTNTWHIYERIIQYDAIE